jgi:hypothetical protein
MAAAILPVTLTIARAVSETGIPRSNLYVLAGRGAIDIRKSGRRSLVTGESLSRYLESLPSAQIGGTR